MKYYKSWIVYFMWKPILKHVNLSFIFTIYSRKEITSHTTASPQRTFSLEHCVQCNVMPDVDDAKLSVNMAIKSEYKYFRELCCSHLIYIFCKYAVQAETVALISKKRDILATTLMRQDKEIAQTFSIAVSFIETHSIKNMWDMLRKRYNTVCLDAGSLLFRHWKQIVFPGYQET